MFIIFIGFKPALEGRAVVNLQMSNTFAAFQDICESIKVSPTAELLTNRGVINQVILRVISLCKYNYVIFTNHCKYVLYPLTRGYRNADCVYVVVLVYYSVSVMYRIEKKNQ